MICKDLPFSSRALKRHRPEILKGTIHRDVLMPGNRISSQGSLLMQSESGPRWIFTAYSMEEKELVLVFFVVSFCFIFFSWISPSSQLWSQAVAVEICICACYE